jgi:hypothetical protein
MVNTQQFDHNQRAVGHDYDLDQPPFIELSLLYALESHLHFFGTTHSINRPQPSFRGLYGNFVFSESFHHTIMSGRSTSHATWYTSPP